MADLYIRKGPNSSRTLAPAKSPIVNVVKDYRWTLSENRAEVSSARVVEYYQNSGQLISALAFYAKQLAGKGGGEENPYKYLYYANPTNFVYYFPYLSDQRVDRTNAFDYGEGKNPFAPLSQIGQLAHAIGRKADQGLTAKVAEFFTGVGQWTEVVKSLLGSFQPGRVDMLSPESWKSSDDANYTFNFDLLNTYDSSAEIKKNRELCFLLSYQNAPYRRNVSIMDPVCIYDVHIPDVISLPVCFISNLKISNLGNSRILYFEGKPRLIPEAYRLSITFSSLLEASRNILWGVEENKPIQVIEKVNAYEMLKEAGPEVGNMIKDTLAGEKQGSANSDSLYNNLFRTGT